ncbi:RDD family protein [Orrella marina]|uniref:RDD family protein n=1 Tax=Orrella marina TaxID=2163011 RepID=A0A2R4XIU6_9BURK|nr:RDD family protein [Orrella marina]AWB33747.1 RDD family protein [Orrella marina]
MSLSVPSPSHTLPEASRGKRFASMMYEGVLLFAVVFIADYLFDALTQSRHGLTLRLERQVILFLAIGVYFFICWRAGGQTLPMKAWHIKLVSQDTSRPSAVQLVGRYMASWIVPLVGMAMIHAVVLSTGLRAIYLFAVGAPFLIFIPTWFRRDGQFLHDVICGTRIVDIRQAIGA